MTQRPSTTTENIASEAETRSPSADVRACATGEVVRESIGTDAANPDDSPVESPKVPALTSEVAKLAYDAIVSYLEQQDTTLGNCRNRATWLIVAAGLFATLAANVGLLNSDPSKGAVAPPWFRLLLVGLIAAISVVALTVVWPVAAGWAYGPSAKAILKRQAMPEAELRQRATKALIRGAEKNSRVIKYRVRLLAAGVALLSIEILSVFIVQILP